MIRNNRTASILKAAVKEFIGTGIPVSSSQLYHRYNFGIKPAMIRHELSSLCEDGYLEQVHRSGGRVPTNKAYRFFVKDFLEEEEFRKRKTLKFLSLIEEIERGLLVKEVFEDCVKCLALELDTLSIGYLAEKRGKLEGFYAHGLENLITRLEFQTKREILEVLRDFESMTEKLAERRDWWNESRDWPQVFFGRSPVTRSDNLAVVADKMELDENRDFLILTLTPKRTDYSSLFYVLRTLEDFIKNKSARH